MNAVGSRRIWIGIVVAACFAAQGCGPSDPLEMSVKADSLMGFSMWKEQARDRLGPSQMADFEEAVQEIRFRMMANGTASGTEAVDEATRGTMDGHSVRYVLELGLGWELGRLQAERSGLGTAVSGNARARTLPGDTDSADYLHSVIQRQQARVRESDDQIAAVLRKLVALDPEWGKKEFVRPTPPPATTQPAAPTPTDSLPQRIGRGKMQTQANT